MTTRASLFLLGLLGLTCRPTPAAPVLESHVSTSRRETPPGARVGPTAAPAPAPTPVIDSLELLRAAAQQGFADRLRLSDGVLFIDIYDDEGEHPKPWRAQRLCGATLEGAAKQWARNLEARLDPAAAEPDQDFFTCRPGQCRHEAFEAGDFAGSYRFEHGFLTEVTWTSGPPGHVQQSWIDEEQAFVERALTALRTEPCGSIYEEAPSDPVQG